MKPFHRRDRAALVCLRLMVGVLIFECGVRLLQSSWGASEFSLRLNHGVGRSPFAPELSQFFVQLAFYDRIVAQTIVLIHLVGGLLILVGVLTRTASLVLCLLYFGYTLMCPLPLPILVCVCCASLALSDAGQHVTIQRLALPTRANHQSTPTH